jgi:hypothetical protein
MGLKEFNPKSYDRKRSWWIDQGDFKNLGARVLMYDTSESMRERCLMLLLLLTLGPLFDADIRLGLSFIQLIS